MIYYTSGTYLFIYAKSAARKNFYKNAYAAVDRLIKLSNGIDFAKNTKNCHSIYILQRLRKFIHNCTRISRKRISILANRSILKSSYE
jgi:hypothetical protein